MEKSGQTNHIRLKRLLGSLKTQCDSLGQIEQKSESNGTKKQLHEKTECLQTNVAVLVDFFSWEEKFNAIETGMIVATAKEIKKSCEKNNWIISTINGLIKTYESSIA